MPDWLIVIVLEDFNAAIEDRLKSLEIIYRIQKQGKHRKLRQNQDGEHS